MINDNENEAENEKIDNKDITLIDLGLDIYTNTLNIKNVVSV